MKINITVNSRSPSTTELANETAKRAESRQSKQLTEIQESLKRLQAMPSPKALAKQLATNKVAMLKQRLDALKAILLRATPEQAKILARELKGIAKELASAAKNLDSGGGVGVSVTPTVTADNSAGESDSANSTDEAPDALAAEAAAASGAEQSAVSPRDTEQTGEAHSSNDEKSAAPGVSSKSETNGKSAAPDDGEQGLRAALLEAKKLLKEIVGILKAKLAGAGKETKHDLKEIDKSLSEIEHALAQGGELDLYTGQGELSADGAASGAAISVTGGNVNLSV